MFQGLVLISYLVLFAYLSWRNLKTAIFLLIVLLPTYVIRFQIGPFPTTLLELMFIIVFLIWLIKNKVSLQGILKLINQFKIPLIIFIAGATISIFTAPSIREAAGIWKAYFIEPVLFFILLINFFKEKKDYQYILFALGLTTIGFGILATIQKLTGWGIYENIWQPENARRITLTFTSPNAVGLYLGPIVVLYFGWLWTETKNFSKTLFKIAALVLGLLAIWFAVSRGAIIGVLAGLTFISFFALSKKWTSLSLAVLFGLLLIISKYSSALWSILFFQVPSGQLRLDLWQGSLKMLLDNPLFGAGLSGFNELFEKYRPQNYTETLIYPHNIFLNFWSETGIIGLIGFIAIVFIFFVIGFKIYKNKIKREEQILNISLMAVMISILVHGLVDVPYFKNDLAMLFWIFVSLLIIIYNKNMSLLVMNKNEK